jgi:hypothetical protein
MKKDERFWLVVLFRLGGCGLMLATFAVFLPVTWMSTIHGWLGFGNFPTEPIVPYLARSTSALYAMHGTVMFAISMNLQRYWNLVLLIGALNFVFGIVVTVTDIIAPLPWYWTLAEGPPVVFVGALICWLWHQSNSRQTSKF